MSSPVRVMNPTSTHCAFTQHYGVSIRPGKSIYTKKKVYFLATQQTAGLFAQLRTFTFFSDVIPLVLEPIRSRHSYKAEAVHTNTHEHTFPINRAGVMALGKKSATVCPIWQLLLFINYLTFYKLENSVIYGGLLAGGWRRRLFFQPWGQKALSG